MSKTHAFLHFYWATSAKKYGPRDVHRTVPELSLSLASHRCLRRAAHPGAASDPRRPDGRIRSMASSPSSSPSPAARPPVLTAPHEVRGRGGQQLDERRRRRTAGVIKRYKQSVAGWPRIFSRHPPKLLLLLIPLFLVLFPLTHPPLTNSFPNVSNLGVRWPAAAGALLASFTGLGIHQR